MKDRPNSEITVTADDSPPPLEPTVPRRRRVNWRVRGGFAGALLVAGLVLIGKAERDERANLEAQALRLEQTHGIRIGYGNPADFWAPPYLPEDATVTGMAAMTPAKPRDAALSLNGIEAALRQYPPGFVSKLIKAVFICGELEIEGELAGGTYRYAWIIISARSGRATGDLRRLGFEAFHHELSSFVLSADVGTRPKWSEFAPAGWHYADRSGDQLRRAATPDPPLDTGFLNAYGATSIENDFNMYAEAMFAFPDYVACLAQQHPLIRRKLDFVMATYVAMDPAFTERFREMGLAGGCTPSSSVSPRNPTSP